jgi:hypothetical protein
MFDLLMELGCDPMQENCDGLTAFGLSVRFGLWDMFHHIWKGHLTTSLWTFGNVKATGVEYQQFQKNSNGLAAFESVKEINMCIEALAHHYMTTRNSEQEVGQARSFSESTYSTSTAMRRIAENHVRASCKVKLEALLKHKIWYGKLDLRFLDTDIAPEVMRRRRSLAARAHDVKSAVKIITYFRPKDWYQHTKEIMEKVVLHKWSQGYYLVHVGDSLIPYCVLILLFGLMWWRRRLNVLEHRFWWTDDVIFAPDPKNGIESACGWSAIRDSQSGRLQAVLASYGVLSLLRLALIQGRVRPSDLDENVNWSISTEELIGFIYLNLEPFLHVIVAGLFITILFSRAAAGDACHVAFVRMEKNCTSIAALGLFFNLFILCKPYKGFGLLVLTWYRFLLADLFNFLVMYCMVFTAFLIAIQTLHNANYEFLMWLDQTDSILPRVREAIGKQYPDAANQTALTYLANTNPSNANLLLTANVELNGCLHNRRTIADTAFSLLEISFGDGLADALEQARTKPYNCAGFAPEYLLGYLLIFWVFLTNVIIINMLIAMMNSTFDDQREKLSSVWLLDISKRILRYDKQFPELGPHMARAVEKNSIFTTRYWAARVNDALIVLHCIPEVHLFEKIRQVIHVWHINSTPDDQENGNFGSWDTLRTCIDDYWGFSADMSSHISLWNFFWHPHLSLIKFCHRISYKAVNFGQACATASGKNDPPQDRLVSLICGLNMLKDTLSKPQLEVVPLQGVNGPDSKLLYDSALKSNVADQSHSAARPVSVPALRRRPQPSDILSGQA